MAPVILYILLAIIQGHGGIAEPFGTLEECQAKRAELLASPSPEILALSDCVQVTITKTPAKT